MHCARSYRASNDLYFRNTPSHGLNIHISSKTRSILKKVVVSRGSVVFRLIIKET